MIDTNDETQEPLDDGESDPYEGTTRRQRRTRLYRGAKHALADFKHQKGAHPIELSELLLPEQVGEHRNLYCPVYDACLERVAATDWRSFSCSKCPNREKGKPPKAEEFEAASRLTFPEI